MADPRRQQEARRVRSVVFMAGNCNLKTPMEGRKPGVLAAFGLIRKLRPRGSACYVVVTGALLRGRYDAAYACIGCQPQHTEHRSNFSVDGPAPMPGPLCDPWGMREDEASFFSGGGEVGSGENFAA